MFINEPTGSRAKGPFEILWNAMVIAAAASASLASVTAILERGSVDYGLLAWPVIAFVAFIVGILTTPIRDE